MDRKVLLAISGTMFVVGVLGGRVIKQQDDKYARLLSQAKITHKILMKFVDRSDPRLAEEIKAECEFDWIIKDLPR